MVSSFNTLTLPIRPRWILILSWQLWSSGTLNFRSTTERSEWICRKMKIVSATIRHLGYRQDSTLQWGYRRPLRCRVVPAIEAVQTANGFVLPPLVLRSFTQRSDFSALADPNRFRIVRRNCPFRDAM